MSKTPVVRTMREQIADYIRGDVFSGRLASGMNLREQALAERYGVSRAPIRDALLQLTQEGLLEAKPNCGVRVGSSSSEILQPFIVKLRQEIELFALTKTINRLGPVEFKKLDQFVDGLRRGCRNEEIGEVIFYDMALHRLLVESSGVDGLLAIWLPIVSRMMLHYSRHGDMMESHSEHVSIVKALRQRDLPAATAALMANIQ